MVERLASVDTAAADRRDLEDRVARLERILESVDEALLDSAADDRVLSQHGISQ